MKPIERLLVGLDSGPWSIIIRIGLGLALLPVLRAFSGGSDFVWISLAMFIASMFVLRVAFVLARRVLPFSIEAREIWAARRGISKEYDSYLWQNLFWIGLGMLAYAAIGNGLRHGELVLTILCLIGGGAGLLFWWRTNAAGAVKSSGP